MQEGKPSVVVGQGDDSSRLAVKRRDIIDQNDEDVLESVPSFLSDSADILILVAKEGDRRTASHLVCLVTSTSFEMNNLSGTSNALQIVTVSVLEARGIS